MVRFQLSVYCVTMGDVPGHVNLRRQSSVSDNLRLRTLDAGSKCLPVSEENWSILDTFSDSRRWFGRARVQGCSSCSGREWDTYSTPVNHRRSMVGKLRVERQLDLSLIWINSILENFEKVPNNGDRLRRRLGRMDWLGFSPSLSFCCPCSARNELQSEGIIFRPSHVSGDFQEQRHNGP